MPYLSLLWSPFPKLIQDEKRPKSAGIQIGVLAKFLLINCRDVSDWSVSFFVVLGALPRNPVVDKLWKGQLYQKCSVFEYDITRVVIERGK
jgi:hypothetical protein